MLKGYTLHIYKSDLNFKKLSFEILFKTNDFFPNYSVSTGGRIAEFKDDKILFSLGYSGSFGAAQDSNRLLGKIISIDLKNSDYKIISIGHRNPQGLIYLKEKNLIINSEHGPKGGDEINFNYFDENKIPNYGWDIVSYGIEYDGTDPYKRPHKEYGFIEPFKVFETSIGISELVYLS
jgi:glucose/arabinose dehydrogenase